MWGITDHDEWAIGKIRQHASDPSKTAEKTGFEQSGVVNLNAELAKLLRSAVRGGGQPRDRSSTSSQAPKHGKDGPFRGTATCNKQRAENTGDDEERSIPSADEE